VGHTAMEGAPKALGAPRPSFLSGFMGTMRPAPAGWQLSMSQPREAAADRSGPP